MNSSEKPILFFDGVCNLCNGYIDFLLRLGAGKKILFASLQGETAKKLLSENNRNALHSVIFYDRGAQLERSAAVLAVIAELSFPWNLLGIFRIIPRALRDRIYDFIASHRYQWFGTREQCRLPTPQERTLFLP